MSVNSQISKNGILNRISVKQTNLIIGEITSLLLLSSVHRKMEIRDIADVILPAVNLNQFRIYRNSKQQPIGFVTWAFFSKEVEEEYLKGKAVLSDGELKSGEIIYITDFIAPYGHAKQIIKDLRENIFPNKQAKALRFKKHGEYRKKLWSLSGKNTLGGNTNRI